MKSRLCNYSRCFHLNKNTRDNILKKNLGMCEILLKLSILNWYTLKSFCIRRTPSWLAWPIETDNGNIANTICRRHYEMLWPCGTPCRKDGWAPREVTDSPGKQFWNKSGWIKTRQILLQLCNMKVNSIILPYTIRIQRIRQSYSFTILMTLFLSMGWMGWIMASKYM